nr:NADPH dehydrogenase NamA [Halalkalibacter urbisdiaboli]
MLFSPLTFGDVALKNRIVMSPMCMYSCDTKDGKIRPFHITHYESRAIGQVGLVMLEATAVQPEGRISDFDLGIWQDGHIEGLKKTVERIKVHGAKAAIQLAHAGRKATVDGPIFAPSAVPFDNMKTPVAMSEADITKTIKAFALGAQRAKEAGFDIIEIHAAHGYLINEFLSPLTNLRTDAYGGNLQGRYRILHEIIEAVQAVFNGPLFVRLSTDEYAKEGNTLDDFIQMATWLKEQGITLIDCSSGGVIPAHIPTYPGYQVRRAEAIRNQVNIPTGAVGLITTGIQAEEILQNERADLIFIARGLLRNPYWPVTAADDLNYRIEAPNDSYQRGWY